MKANKQIKLLNECVDWFDQRYPQLAGLITIIPAKRCEIKRPLFPWRKGFRIHTNHARLMFNYHHRVWFFSINEINFPIRSNNQINHEHWHKYIKSLDEFSHEIIDILVYYQSDHP